MFYIFNVNIVEQYSCLGEICTIWPQRLLTKLPHLAGMMERVASCVH